MDLSLCHAQVWIREEKGVLLFCTFPISVTKATPLAKQAWGLSNQMTARSLDAIGKNGGPRCCKRDSYLAIVEAVKFTEEKLGIKMETGLVVCTRAHLNNQCRREQCPFYKEN